MSITITTLYTVDVVRDATVESGFDCPECSDMDAFIEVNLYVRELGQYTRFVECCIPCAKRIAVDERPAEVLIEVPESLAADAVPQLSKIN
jgi:hypothetical protein